MIEADDFVVRVLRRGYSFWSGVPCSFLTPLINRVCGGVDLDYIGAASEGEALGIAAGAHLAGRKSVALCQNSGLGNMVNPLTSLQYPFRIPTLLLVSHRGAPGLDDEPQHELMGRIIERLLEVVHVPWEVFPDQVSEIEPALERAEKAIDASSRPFAFIVKHGALHDARALPATPVSVGAQAIPVGVFELAGPERMPRIEAIRTIRGALEGDEALIATTGKIGRELFTLGHRPNQLYVVGSMGCASAIGLGLHEASRRVGRLRRVVVLDGDGASLMKLGVLGTIGHYGPSGLTHVVIDNEVHDSTGGQPTVSPTVDFATVAAGCGYRHVWRVDSIGSLALHVREAREMSGPNLIHVKVAPGSIPNLGRPKLAPPQVKELFMSWLAET